MLYALKRETWTLLSFEKSGLPDKDHQSLGQSFDGHVRNKMILGTDEPRPPPSLTFSPLLPLSLSEVLEEEWIERNGIGRIMGNTIGWKEGEGRGEMDFRTYLMVLYHLIHTLGQKSRSEKWRESMNWRKCNNNKQCIIWRLDGFNGRRRYDSKV